MRLTVPLATLLWSACGSPTPPAPPPTGSQACASCHADIVAAWQDTNHALAERPITAVAGAFDHPGAPSITLPTADGPLPQPVVRVLGVAPLWQPLIATTGGRIQASSIAYDPQQEAWFDVFDDVRSPGAWGHWTGAGMTWNSQCAACHNTGVDKGWDPAARTYATTVAGMGVQCEACHGPSGLHAARPTTPTPGPHDRESAQATCDSCHIRWTPTTPGFVPGEALLDHGLPALPGSDPGFRADGAVVAESFEAVPFRSSRMHAAGVRCVDCHDPHTAQLKAPGAAVCATCHAATPDHDHHDGRIVGTPDCIDCHMPVTTYMQRDPRHDHGFRVPDPVLDAELGYPSVCSGCHSDGVLPEAAPWWPAPRDRARTRAIHAASQGPLTPGITAALDAAYAAETHPLWRAILLGLRPGADDDRIQALSSTDPWLRRAAVASSADVARLQEALTDPVRAVRLEAATALQPVLPPDDARARELRDHLERLSDHASAAFALGSWWAGHGHTAQAGRWLQQAVDLDPASPDAWRALAITQSTAGRPLEAAATLARATARLPDSAELHFLHGLALSGTGGDAASAFRRALEADPDHGRAAYNLGLALHAQGDPAGRDLLARAATLLPDDPAPPYALATIALAAGDRKEAARQAEAALQRDSGHALARQLLDGIGSR